MALTTQTSRNPISWDVPDRARYSIYGFPVPETVRYIEVRHDVLSFNDVVWWKNRDSEQVHSHPLVDLSYESLNALIAAMRLSV